MNIRQLIHGMLRLRNRNRSGELSRLKIKIIKAGEGSWIEQNLVPPFLVVPEPSLSRVIENAAKRTQNLGAMSLWSGYSDLENYPYEVGVNASRTSEQVRTSRELGNFFAWLITKRRPQKVVEFGTAFGMSGMYFLAGIEAVGQGELLTFEPNESWANLARGNLENISKSFVLTIGTFEDNIDKCMNNNDKIDIALIDAIHTSEFVNRQFSIVMERLAPQGLVLFDDIGFSEDMIECWRNIATSKDIRASAQIQGVGLIEMY